MQRAHGARGVFRFPKELRGLAQHICDVEAQRERLRACLTCQANRALDATLARKRLMLVEQTLAHLNTARGEIVRRRWIGGSDQLLRGALQQTRHPKPVQLHAARKVSLWST